MASLEVRGLEAANHALLSLTDKMERRVLAKATREGTKVLADAAKERAPVDTGLLRRSITVRALKRKRGVVGARVTIKNSELIATTTKGGKRHFYPSVLEYGAKNHPPQPFMRPAFDAKKDAAVKKTSDEIHIGVEREIHKR